MEHTKDFWKKYSVKEWSNSTVGHGGSGVMVCDWFAACFHSTISFIESGAFVYKRDLF